MHQYRVVFRTVSVLKFIAITLGFSLLVATQSVARAQEIRCHLVALDLGIREIPGLLAATYRPKGYLDIRCFNETSHDVALKVAVFDSMPQPHRLGKERSRDNILLWLYSNEARTMPIGSTPEKGLSNSIHLSAGQSGDIRFPLFPELLLPKLMPAGDFSHPLTLQIQWRLESPVSTAAF